MKVEIADIIIDQAVQLASRQTDMLTVQAYAEAIEGGAQFPPIVVFQDHEGKLRWADGLHRIEAHDYLGLTEIEADVRQGDREEAMIFAATANVTNGKPMSQTEKREAGIRLLEMTTWSNREIARRLSVNEATVRRWRDDLSAANAADSTRTVIRNGVAYKMDVSNIGQHQLTAPTEKLQQEVGEDAHEPVAENTATELANILADARQATPASDTPLVEQPIDAQALTLHRTLELTEERKEVLKSCQGWVVAHLARTGVWRAHPDGYTSIREYLRAAGVKPADVSTLTAFAEKVVPYCDEKGIEIDHLLTNEDWPKFRAGMTAIKKAVREDDPAALEDILYDVERALTAHSITEKYREPTQILAKGASLRVDGRVVYILVCGTDKTDTDDAADKLARRLGRLVEWSLLVTKNAEGELVITNQDDENG